MHEHGRMYSRVSRDRHVSPLCGSRSVFISPGVALLISAFHICAWVKFSLCLYLLNHCSRLWTQCSCPRLSLSYVLFAICGRQLSATATRSRAVAAKRKPTSVRMAIVCLLMQFGVRCPYSTRSYLRSAIVCHRKHVRGQSLPQKTRSMAVVARTPVHRPAVVATGRQPASRVPRGVFLTMTAPSKRSGSWIFVFGSAVHAEACNGSSIGVASRLIGGRAAGCQRLSRQLFDSGGGFSLSARSGLMVFVFGSVVHARRAPRP
jgi:hypothetical protein